MPAVPTAPRSRFVLASDVGGTFTDTVLVDLESGRTWSSKVPSRNRRQEEAVAAGIKATLARFRGDVDDGAVAGVGGDLSSLGPLAMHHGSTVATNALLERRGATLALVTNTGFEDLVAIRRQDRPHLYDLNVTRTEPLASAGLRFGVPVRRGPRGEDWRDAPKGDELDGALDTLATRLRDADVDAVAVGLLHADLHPDDEVDVADGLRTRLPGVHVVASHEVWPEVREVERFETTLVDAYLQPVLGPYLQRLERAVAAGVGPLGGLEALRVVDSAGALHPVQAAGRRPAALLLSGPAGGVAAAAGLGRALDAATLVTFDVGGTSTDVALVRDGQPARALGSTVGGFACRFPSVDVHTLGAGGGSRLWRDAGGHLQVGPESQGAYPGPACYGRGGELPTLTDALVMAGRIPPGLPLGERTRLDAKAAHRAMEPLAHRLRTSLEATAVGAIRLAVEVTAGGVRMVTTHRGHDPRDAALCAYGGAGPLLAAELADVLGIRTVFVPWDAGTFSARGLAGAPVVDRAVVGLEVTLTGPTASDAPLAAAWDEAVATLATGKGVLRGRAACRYVGQSYELEVEVDRDLEGAGLEEAFATKHEQEFGHRHGDRAVEVVRLVVERLHQVVDPGWQVQDPTGGARRPDGWAAESRLWCLDEAGSEVVERAARVVWRSELSPGQWVPGPLVVPDPTATTYVPPGWAAAADARTRTLLLKRLEGLPGVA